ncbi:MAG: DUF2330 domain-containing protein [Sandaracinaceae bacterium]|nr:DUF2330 domain-containing protein [Sandaracinaceae bacterium]
MRTYWPLAALALLAPSPVHAFCGFYVAGADAELFADATNVVLMRRHDTTILSMQNDYRGPPEDFALVVPVPVVLSEDDVKTLPRELFTTVDRLASPRLVEYWEHDPCTEDADNWGFGGLGLRGTGRGGGGVGEGTIGLGVTVEAEFAVGEYDIVILSAEDSSGLETWLRGNDYHIPDGAEAALRPYVEAGTKFFVARVNVDRVTFESGRAVLSPLRVHYDSERFELPVRLGLLNSDGTQDLVVHILAPGQRFEVANYDNVTIPTNLDVDDSVREQFGGFYAALFDATVERHPGAVVTEYAWLSSNCDPCPGDTYGLSQRDLFLLGADALGASQPGPGFGSIGLGSIGRPRPAPRPARSGGDPSIYAEPWVLTRLHYRYGEGALTDDLVFRAAPAIVGGREVRGEDGALSLDAQPAEINAFQGRYAIRHPWEGPIECDEPVRGRWGGPPGQPMYGTMNAAADASDRVAARAGGEAVVLSTVLRQPVPALGLGADDVGERPAPEETEPEEPATEAAPAQAPAEETSGCGCRVGASARKTDALLMLAVLGLGLLRRRRR